MSVGDWIDHNGGPCPIKNDDTVFDVKFRDGRTWTWLRLRHTPTRMWGHNGTGLDIVAYRVVDAFGADARPYFTIENGIVRINADSLPKQVLMPRGYDDLVFDDDGWSQPFMVHGVRPDWLLDDDRTTTLYGVGNQEGAAPDSREWGLVIAIRLKRREPKRETVQAYLYIDDKAFVCTIDTVGGKPDPLSLRVKEDTK